MTLTSETFNGSQKNVSFVDIPEICPICQAHNAPSRVGLRHKENKELEIVYQCANHNCNSLFIAYYEESASLKNYYNLKNVAPKKISFIEFSEEIQSISKEFIKIYNQANVAESMGLDQVTGVGYRKAFEFLIKDYLCAKSPENTDSILKESLGKVIKERIDDVKIRKCAERAVWIGNDETHYIKKWENKDVKDLKILIALTIRWLESNILTEKYIESMSQ